MPVTRQQVIDSKMKQVPHLLVSEIAGQVKNCITDSVDIDRIESARVQKGESYNTDTSRVEPVIIVHLEMGA